MADFYVWNMYKFDITSLVGETILDAQLNLFLFQNNNSSGSNVGHPCWRAQSANGTDDQDWTTADAVAKLYNDICEYTRTNFSFADRNEFTPSTPVGVYYQWDLTTALQDALSDGDDFLTPIISRDTTQGTGTLMKRSATSTTHPISQGGTSVESYVWISSDNANSRPFLQVTVPENVFCINPTWRRHRRQRTAR